MPWDNPQTAEGLGWLQLTPQTFPSTQTIPTLDSFLLCFYLLLCWVLWCCVFVHFFLVLQLLVYNMHLIRCLTNERRPCVMF